MTQQGPGPALSYILEMIPKWAPWMSKNLFLALVPLLLAILLFTRARRRTPLWWAGAVVFVAFLPNAPYVLADYRWLVGPWRNAWYHDRWRFLLILPVWGLYFGIGFGIFVFSVRAAQRYVSRNWSSSLGLVTVVVLSLASSLGLYLGRSDFNSWSLLAEPYTVADALVDLPAADAASGNIVVAFGVLLVGYCVMIALVSWGAARVRSRTVSPPSSGSAANSSPADPVAV